MAITWRRIGDAAGEDYRHAAALMIVGMLAFAALDGLRKAMAADVPLTVIVATRYAVFTVVVAAWLPGEGRALLRTSHLWLQLARSLVMVAEASVFVLALRHASLANASAAFAVAPVAGVVLAIVLLREHARPATWAALAVSLAGIVIMLHPEDGTGGQRLGLALALASALLYGLYGVLTRKVHEDGARTSFAYMTLGGLAACLVALAVTRISWHPDGRNGLLLAGAAVAAAVGQYLLIRAYGKAPAVTLQPFNYFLFAWSVPISMIFFGSPPSLAALAGAVLVIGAGAYLFGWAGAQ
jgi:drug/metabolite transporter (DMT)-like permease